MRCVYCDQMIKKESIYSILIEKDLLCNDCRKSLIVKRRYKKLDKYQVEYFYDYDGLFRSLLLQYKECHDEILKDVFLYHLKDYLNIKYYSYKLILVPSSKQKLKQRGFNHLDLIFSDLKLERINNISMKEDLIQEGKGLEMRKAMLNNYIYEGDNLKKVLLVDDVMTTGSSLLGMCRALEKKVSLIKLLCLSCK